MLFLRILLIPIIIALKFTGAIVCAGIKFIGFTLSAVSHVCGWFTSLIGGFIFIISVFYTVCGFVNFGGLGEIELWWVSSIIGIGVGLFMILLSEWVDELGMLIYGWGYSLREFIRDIPILPC